MAARRPSRRQSLSTDTPAARYRGGDGGAWTGKVRAGGHALAPAWGEAIVTAPTRSAVEVLASFAGETLRFIAPDALLASKEAAWLIVDEAAAIPAPLLRQLVSRFPHATHHDGARVRGHRSRILKFAPVCPICTVHPERPDPLGGGPSAGVSYQSCLSLTMRHFATRRWGAARGGQSVLLATQPALPEAMYQLVRAHYRTSRSICGA